MECTLVRGDGSRWKVTDMKLRSGRPKLWAHRPSEKSARSTTHHWETLDGVPLQATDRIVWSDRDGRQVWELRGRTGSGRNTGGASLAGGAPETEAEVRDAVDDGFFEDSFLAPDGDARA